MKRETVLLHGGACAGMQVLWQAWDEIRMVKCLDGHAPWPANADNPALEYEIYRPSLDSPHHLRLGPQRNCRNCRERSLGTARVRAPLPMK